MFCTQDSGNKSSLDGAAAESGAGGCLCHALPRIPLHFIQATYSALNILKSLKGYPATAASREQPEKIGCSLEAA
ncbi:MAG: hypothetical protein N2A40_04675 [Desulfobulbaceae bacterium]